MDKRPQCNHTKGNSERCRAKARPGGSLCWCHDPALADQRARARSAGGRAATRRVVLPADAGDVPLRTVNDVVTLLARSINEVRRGALDMKVGNTVGYLASVLLRALTDGDLEARLCALEKQLAERTGSGRAAS
jgi:hypothetical protein